MSMVGELTYVLGMQVTKKNDEIFISLSKYATNLVKNLALRMLVTREHLLRHMSGF